MEIDDITSLNLIVNYDAQETEPSLLVFQDCQSAALELNLAYSGPNSILATSQSRREDGFVEYEIETNTTASKIKVIARKLLLSRCFPDSPPYLRVAELGGMAAGQRLGCWQCVLARYHT